MPFTARRPASWPAFLSLLAILLSVAPAYSEVKAAASPVTYKLPNGLTVLLQEDHSAPVAAFQMWVRVGGADEPEAQAGIAHVFEHMLFKGTKKRVVGQIGREVSAAGGDINAYTSNDQTVYHMVLASRYFDTGLDILADAVQNSSFDPQELKKELEVVVEEINRGRDSQDRALNENIDRISYRVHPYGRPVIGTVETVRSLTREQILAFFKKWYAPNNMTLVIVGDFKVADAKAKIAAALKNFKPNPALTHFRPAEPKQMEMRVTQETRPFQREQLGLAFHIPSIRDDEAYVLDVVSSILSEGPNSLLVNSLVNKLKIASNVGAYSYTPLDPGTFLASAQYEPAKREEVYREMLRIIFDAAHGGMPASRLALAKTSLTSDFLFKLETAQGIASQLGYFQAIVGDLNFEKRYLSVVNGVTPEKAAAIARKYLRPENMTVGVVAPDGTALSIPARLKQIADEEWAAAAKRPAPLQVTQKRVENGTTVVWFENGTKLIVTPDNRLPIVSIIGAFQGGLRNESAAQAGIANFSSGMLGRGSENFTREQIADKLAAVSGSFAAYIGHDFLGFSYQVVRTPDNGDGLPLLAEVLLRPTFPADEVETLRQQLLPAFAKREDDGFQVALLNFLPRMFGNNAYGRMGIGDKAVVQKAGREELKAFAESQLRSDTLVVTVVGDVKTDEFIEDYARLFATHRSPGKYAPIPLEFPTIAASVTATVTKSKAQSHILYGWPAANLHTSDRYAEEVLNAIMAGMGGRLFLELRDRQSLAYSVSSFIPMRQESGAFVVYLGCAPDKLEQSLKGIREQIALVRDHGVLAKEVEEAKRFLIGNLAVDLQTRRARASSMTTAEINGLGYRFDTEAYPKHIDGVTVEQVNAAARKYLDPEKFVLVVVK